jgi:hypothetical protein
MVIPVLDRMPSLGRLAPSVRGTGLNDPYILDHHRRFAALPRMRDHLTVEAVSCDVRCFVG